MTRIDHYNKVFTRLCYEWSLNPTAQNMERVKRFEADLKKIEPENKIENTCTSNSSQPQQQLPDQVEQQPQQSQATRS
jgi:hypothetical protein